MCSRFIGMTSVVLRETLTCLPKANVEWHLPVRSRCWRLEHLVTRSKSVGLVTVLHPCSCRWVSSGHRLAKRVSPRSVRRAPSLRNTRSTLGHAPVRPCPQSRLRTPRIALSPHTASPLNVIVLHSRESQARWSHRLHTLAQMHSSLLSNHEKILITASSGRRSNGEFFEWKRFPFNIAPVLGGSAAAEGRGTSGG